MNMTRISLECTFSIVIFKFLDLDTVQIIWAKQHCPRTHPSHIYDTKNSSEI